MSQEKANTLRNHLDDLGITKSPDEVRKHIYDLFHKHYEFSDEDLVCQPKRAEEFAGRVRASAKYCAKLSTFHILKALLSARKKGIAAAAPKQRQSQKAKEKTHASKPHAASKPSGNGKAKPSGKPAGKPARKPAKRADSFDDLA